MPPAEQRPSVGRIVHYRTRDYEPGLTTVGKWTLPAIITFVHGENRVNLQVFSDSSRGSVWRQDVQLGEESGQWNWPPKT